MALKATALIALFFFIFSLSTGAATAKETKKGAVAKVSSEKKSSKKQAKKEAKKDSKKKEETPPAAGSDTPAKQYSTAVAYHKKKDFKNAITYYNAAIKKDRKYWQAWLGLGICYYSLSKYQNAKLIFQYVLTIKPGEPTAQKYYDIMTKSAKAKPAAQPESRSKGDLMWRSALLPGLGQFYNGELAKGYIYSLGYVASLAAIAKYTFDQNDAVSAYNNANTGFEEKYKAAQDASTKVYIPIAVAATVWAVSVLDAFLTGKDDAPEKIKKTAGLQYDGTAVTARVALVRAEF